MIPRIVKRESPKTTSPKDLGFNLGKFTKQQNASPVSLYLPKIKMSEVPLVANSTASEVLVVSLPFQPMNINSLVAGWLTHSWLITATDCNWFVLWGVEYTIRVPGNEYNDILQLGPDGSRDKALTGTRSEMQKTKRFCNTKYNFRILLYSW